MWGPAQRRIVSKFKPLLEPIQDPSRAHVGPPPGPITRSHPRALIGHWWPSTKGLNSGEECELDDLPHHPSLGLHHACIKVSTLCEMAGISGGTSFNSRFQWRQRLNGTKMVHFNLRLSSEMSLSKPSRSVFNIHVSVAPRRCHFGNWLVSFFFVPEDYLLGSNPRVGIVISWSIYLKCYSKYKGIPLWQPSRSFH